MSIYDLSEVEWKNVDWLSIWQVSQKKWVKLHRTGGFRDLLAAGLGWGLKCTEHLICCQASEVFGPCFKVRESQRWKFERSENYRSGTQYGVHQASQSTPQHLVRTKCMAMQQIRGRPYATAQAIDFLAVGMDSNDILCVQLPTCQPVNLSTMFVAFGNNSTEVSIYGVT